jgi:pilus assembly protein Flp/PilA
MVEYALILVLVAVVVVVVLSTLGTAIGGVFSNVVKCLNTRSC